MPRKSKGRQKIEMTRMSKESNLLVTFSKRRSGLFKKASELCTLCGAEIAIIVFSPGKKAFSFGHPSVGAISDRFLSRNAPPPSAAEDHRAAAAVRELNVQLTEVMNQLDAEKKRGEVRRESGERCWWEGPVDGLGPEQLEQLKVAMEDLKKSVVSGLGLKNGLGYFVGSSSMGEYGGGGPDMDVKASGLGLSMTPHGYALGYGRGYY